MNTSTTEENGKTQAAGPAEDSKPKKRAHVGARGAHVAAKKGQSGKKATPPKKAARKAKSARDGSKTAHIIELLERSGGATMKALMKATGWQPHSVRGFLSGTVSKKMGLTVTSTKGQDGERSYSIKG